MSNTSFEKYLPNRTIIYDYVSTSLIEKELIGTWLSEATKPLLFCCVNCKASTIDLTKLEYTGGEFPRTSIEQIKEYAGNGFTPWNIRCLNCQSIYEISNGWTEPNNGRMIITLGRVNEIKPNPKLSEVAFAHHVFNQDGVKKYVANYHKFLFQIKVNLDHATLSFTIENVLGKRIALQGFHLVFFAEKEGILNLKYILETASQNAFEEISKEDIRITKSLGLKITNIELVKIETTGTLEKKEDKEASTKKELLEKFKLLLLYFITSKDNEVLKMQLRKNGFEVENLLDD